MSDERNEREGAATGANGLKAERVQEPLALKAVQGRLKAERVQERLRQMPGWRLIAGNATDPSEAIDRAREFRQPEDAVDFATLVLRMASRERYPARVQVR